MTFRKFFSIALALYGVNISAHHGNSEYDQSRVIDVQGVITKFEWRNPHAYLYLRTTDQEGREGQLRIESASPSALFAYGVSRDSFSEGEMVTATISPSRSRPMVTAFGYRITKSNGNIIPLTVRDAAEIKRDKPVANSIAGIWVPRQEYFYQMIQSRPTWPMTPKARAAWQSYNIKQSSMAKCVPPPPPMLMTYPNITRIDVHDGYVSILMDGQGDLAERIIYTDGRGHPDAGQQLLHGHSVGRWQGTTLIVETTNFTPNDSGSIAGIPGGTQKKLTERFELTDDGNGLTYYYKVEDPEFLSSPYSAQYVWDFRPDVSLTGVDCDPEVASRYLDE